MMRRSRVSFVAMLAMACVHCSLLLYNGDDFSGASETPPPTSNDSGATDATTDREAAPPVDASVIDAGADVRSIPDSAEIWPVNGHGYELVLEEGIDWNAAKLAAEKRGGHLVTITSEAENDFVFKIAEASDKAWLSDGTDGLLLGPWIGCIQAKGSPEPDGGYGWVTGEPLVYSNFGNDQPDNSGGENACHFFAYGEKAPVWNDNFDTQELSAFVVEYE